MWALTQGARPWSYLSSFWNPRRNENHTFFHPWRCQRLATKEAPFLEVVTYSSTVALRCRAIHLNDTHIINLHLCFIKLFTLTTHTPSPKSSSTSERSSHSLASFWFSTSLRGWTVVSLCLSSIDQLHHVARMHRERCSGRSGDRRRVKLALAPDFISCHPHLLLVECLPRKQVHVLFRT